VSAPAASHPAGPDFAAAVAELRAGERFLLTTHENPDGDALGSLLAMHAALVQLGKDALMFMAPGELPPSIEYRFLPLAEVVEEAPADVAERTLVFLDCGNIDRMPVEFLHREGAHVLNIDHHHDNTRFGAVNLIDDAASSTAQIVFDLLGELGAELTAEIALALYVGLATDTGRFMYENTDARAHRTAAALIEAGVVPAKVHALLYGQVPIAKAKLIARALDNLALAADGQIAAAYLSAADYATAGADGGLTEGIIDFVRAVEGARVAMLVRDRLDSEGTGRKVSLRARDEAVDVSAIARSLGGGGHRMAAGFTTELPYAELVELVGRELAAQKG